MVIPLVLKGGGGGGGGEGGLGGGKSTPSTVAQKGEGVRRWAFIFSNKGESEGQFLVICALQ